MSCKCSGLADTEAFLIFTWLLFLSQSAAPPHFPALLSRWWKISQQTWGRQQTWTRKIQMSPKYLLEKYEYLPKNAQKLFIMWHSWLWLLRDQGSVIINNFGGNFNPIRKPGRHLPDIISYQPNEDWWLAKDTNWCCHWEKRFKWELISPPQPQGCLWPCRHSQIRRCHLLPTPELADRPQVMLWMGKSLSRNVLKLGTSKIIVMVSVSDESNVLNVKKKADLHIKNMMSWIVRRKHRERS